MDLTFLSPSSTEMPGRGCALLPAGNIPAPLTSKKLLQQQGREVCACGPALPPLVVCHHLQMPTSSGCQCMSVEVVSVKERQERTREKETKREIECLSAEDRLPAASYI